MKFTAFGLAVLVSTAALLHSSMAADKIECFNDDALETLISDLGSKCTGYDLTCAPSCDEAIKCYFEKMDLWHPKTKFNWNKVKAEFEKLFKPENKTTADDVFEEFKKAEEKAKLAVGHGLVTRYMTVAKKYCTDPAAEAIASFKCEKCKL
ncbi:hypothetical protein GQ42DRAFT_165024 [Ramicandelaber brevisporus]|nr:hypothetical protein GQ42DRAFT_165024 [Ramicandelaber brevisporus]